MAKFYKKLDGNIIALIVALVAATWTVSEKIETLSEELSKEISEVSERVVRIETLLEERRQNNG